jgi:hypothetical protein
VAEQADIQLVTMVARALEAVVVVDNLLLQALLQRLLVALVLSLLDIHNQQPMLCLTLQPLQFGNAQQVLTLLITW